MLATATIPGRPGPVPASCWQPPSFPGVRGRCPHPFGNRHHPRAPATKPGRGWARCVAGPCSQPYPSRATPTNAGRSRARTNPHRSGNRHHPRATGTNSLRGRDRRRAPPRPRTHSGCRRCFPPPRTGFVSDPGERCQDHALQTPYSAPEGHCFRSPVLQSRAGNDGVHIVFGNRPHADSAASRSAARLWAATTAGKSRVTTSPPSTTKRPSTTVWRARVGAQKTVAATGSERPPA